MYYHPTHRIGYLVPPRTASRSVGRALTMAGFDVDLTHNPHHINGDMLTASDVVYCTVRHHCDALVSIWSHLAEGNDFSEWLHGTLLAGGSGWEPWIDRDGGSMWLQWTMYAQQLVHFENLADELAAVLPMPVALPYIIDPHRKRDGHDWRPYYEDADRAAVWDVFGGEMRALGYEI